MIIQTMTIKGKINRPKNLDILLVVDSPLGHLGFTPEQQYTCRKVYLIVLHIINSISQ